MKHESSWNRNLYTREGHNVLPKKLADMLEMHEHIHGLQNLLVV